MKKIIILLLLKLCLVSQAQTYHLSKTINAHEGAFSYIRLSNDGRTSYMASGSRIYLRDAQTGELKKILGQNKEAIINLQISPKDSYLIATGLSGDLVLYDLKTNTGHPLKGHTKITIGLCFLNERYAVSSSTDTTTRIWDTQSKNLAVEIEHFSPINTVACSHDESRIATGDLGGSIQIFDVAQQLIDYEVDQKLEKLKMNNAIIELSRGENTIWSLAFSPDDKKLLVGSSIEDGWQAISRWDLASETLEDTHQEESGLIMEMVFNASGNKLYTANSSRNYAAAYSYPDMGLIAVYPMQDFVRTIAVNQEETLLYTSDAKSGVKQWDLNTGLERQHYPAYPDEVASLARSLDQNYFASASEQGEVIVWSSQDKTLHKTLFGARSKIMDLAFHPDSKRIISSSRDGFISLWSIDGQILDVKRFNAEEDERWGYRLALSPDGQTLIVTGIDASIQGFKITENELVRSFSIAEYLGTTATGIYINDITFLPNSNSFALATSQYQIQFYDALTGVFFEEQSIKTSSDVPQKIAIHPDGKRLAVGNHRGDVKLWDFQEESFVMTLARPQKMQWVTAMRFNDDGKTLVVSYAEKEVAIWNVEENQKTQSIYPSNISNSIIFLNDELLLSAGDPNEGGSISIYKQSP